MKSTKLTLSIINSLISSVTALLISLFIYYSQSCIFLGLIIILNLIITFSINWLIISQFLKHGKQVANRIVPTLFILPGLIIYTRIELYLYHFKSGLFTTFIYPSLINLAIALFFCIIISLVIININLLGNESK